ncbi:hypothetical protein C8046_12995 [Serinibacter arcticus]|uniref:DUF559 domain-containing protein n=1 Tax=Serinibacter arcticus TaxID=1655435 RepID=A0A2U1ZWR8_9MICO|nr:hypothetical protein [Serinibacter arcticus]PWD51437.1 hypothetical protein C8046_12995 [Serinibacter arcticus]
MALINNGLPFATSRSSDVGLSPRQLRDAHDGGAVRRMLRGVVVDSRAPDDLILRLTAVALVLPAGAVISDHTAAWVYGADTRPPGVLHDGRVHCLVPHNGTRPTSSLVSVRQTNLPDDDARVIHGVALTSPVRTTSDLLRRLWRPYALAAGDAMVRARAVDVEPVLDYLASLRRVPRLRQARDLAPILDGAADRHGESWMRCRIFDAGLPLPALNHSLQEAGGQEWRLDAFYEAIRLAVEYDGRRHHSVEADRRHDDDRRTHISRVHSIAFEIATRERIIGEDTSFEESIGRALGYPVRPRTW